MIEEDRLISGAKASPQEEGAGAGAPPQTARRLHWPAKIREQLDIFISAAKNRKGTAGPYAAVRPPPGWAKPRWRTSLREKWV